VLAYIAFARPTITREERVSAHKRQILDGRGDSQREFLDFVLEQYIRQGVGELDQEKLPHLLELKYHAVADAVAALGNVTDVREMFVGFQEHLYARPTAE